MKIAVMQPYLFPYLGYFQLIRAVDAFVIYDDVNFIKGGWINRNNILVQGSKQLFTLPLQGASQNLLINQLSVAAQPKKLLQTIKQSYSKAPYFATIFPLIEDVLTQSENNLSRFLDYGLQRICSHLSIQTSWHTSSAIDKTIDLKGQNKILAICRALGASQYINAIGGQELYDRQLFLENGIDLKFIKKRPIIYRQFGDDFADNLSIIDVLMFNSVDQCRVLLDQYDLV